MRNYLTAGILLGLLAGCSSNQDPATAKASATSADGMPLAATGAAFISRAPMSGFASLPDRGELLAYQQVRQVKHRGAYTAYPVAISEAHALNAMRTGEMVINAPDGEPIRLTYERHEESNDGNWTWIGRNADGASAVITFGEKAVFGAIPQGATETLRLTTSAGQSWLVQTDRSKLAGMGGAPRREGGDQLVPPKLSSAAAQTASVGALRAPATTASASASSTVVDVLIGYTPGFVAQIGSESGAVTRLVNMAGITNEAYANSGVNMRIRLVKTLKVNYPDNTDNGDTLEKLTGYEAGDNGGPIDVDPAFDELRETRDEVGADLVSLVRAFKTPENAGCGIAWLIGGDESGIAESDAPFGYSVVSDGNDLDEDDGYTYYCRNETLAHELGHNMGQAHNEEDSDGTGLHAYSYGYRESSSSGFYTVMAYPQADSDQFSISYFANPAVKYSGRPTGVTNKSDNVRSMNQSMPVVANFRETQVPVTSVVLDLMVIKKMGVSATESHTLTFDSKFKTYSAHLNTALGRTGTDNSWEFLVGDYNRDGVTDIYAIKKVAGSGKTEVHVLNGAKGYKTFLLHKTTILGQTGNDNRWQFRLGDYNKDGRLDLFAIDKNAGSGKTEVRVLNGANSFQSYLLLAQTSLAATGNNHAWTFELGDYNQDGVLDLYGIKKYGSARTEVHVLNGVGKFKAFLLRTVTALGPTGFDNAWEFKLGDYDRDGHLDLYGIKKQAGSGKTELHILDGGSRFQTFDLQTTTALGVTGSDSSWAFGLVPIEP